MNRFSNSKTLTDLRKVSDEDLVALYDTKIKSSGRVSNELRRELDRRLQNKHMQHILLMAEENIKLTKFVLLLSAIATILAIIGLFKH